MGDFNDPMMRNPNAAVQARTKAQNRANVLQLKLIGQSHPTGLTNNLLKLFEPRPPLEFKPPPEKRKCPSYSGMAQFVSHFAEPGDKEYAPPVQKGETPAQRRARIHLLRLEKGAQKAAEELEKYDPHKDPNATGDPYKTLFVARLSYESTEHRIKREFEAYGPIKRVAVHLAWRSSTPLKVRLVTDKETNKPRGYAFIEYIHTRDMKSAYKQADGRKLDNRRVLVDVERGRTVPNWRPRRLGGGLGSTRVGGEEVNQKHSGRDQPQAASGRPRSEEPRAREERHVVEREREKSRDRPRDRERLEKLRERSHERMRDREPRDDRIRDRELREERHHHRDRDRNRERDHGRDRGRDRERDRDYGREQERPRDRDRERDRVRERERDRDYGRASHERDRGHTQERDVEYDHMEVVHDRDHQGAIKSREADHFGPNKWGRDYYLSSGKHGHEGEHGGKYYQEEEEQQYDHHEPELYGKEVGGSYQSRAESEPPEEGEAPRDHAYEYHRSERSLSR